ncbi:WD40 repeat-like protein [Gigaspora margarita]|uniref:WD40 repeat-like protein n=1 Tax=Gigaspora margarita TaxID=4874 RepID=A0A8H3WUY2_GIGMA|nr:WD40 repeat-like protein [Gigaspora margarita]
MRRVEGSVFGVRFNDDGKVIASVSDDRTIRVWKITNDNPKPLILYGHIARIWDCFILNDHFISISEDSTCRVWHNRISRNMNDNDISDVDCLACWKGHVDSEKDLVKITLPSVNTYIQLNESNQIPLPSREHVRNFVLVDYCTIVIATNFG